MNIKETLLFLMTLLLLNPLAAQQQKVVGYLPYYRFPILDELQLDKLTHLCIAFANPNAEGYLQTGGVELSPVVKKAKAKGLKVMISLAGGALNPDETAAWQFHQQPQHRTAFIRKILDYVQLNQLDGVDVDLEWKYVGPHYSGFITELGAALHQRGKLMSIAVPARHRYEHLSRPALQVPDFVNIMAYDLTGHWAPDRPGPHSPYDLAVSSLKYWRAQGLPKHKLILGLPFYGWDFTQQRVRSMNYAQIIEHDPAFARGDRMGRVYYNGINTVIKKTKLAMEKAGGLMLWEIGRDAFDPRYSLLSAVDYTLRGRPFPKITDTVSTAVPARIVQQPQPVLPDSILEAGFYEESLVADAENLPVELQVFPNPFVDSLTITNGGPELVALTLKDKHGRPLFETDIRPGAKISWETSSFPQGGYTFSATVEGEEYAKQLVKIGHQPPVPLRSKEGAPRPEQPLRKGQSSIKSAQ